MKLSRWCLLVACVVSLVFDAGGDKSAAYAGLKKMKAKNLPEQLQDVVRFEKDGDISLAIRGYNRIIANFPSSKEAKVAESRLNKIEKLIREKCNFTSDAAMYSFYAIKEELDREEIIDRVKGMAEKHPSVAAEFKNGLKNDPNYADEYYEYYIEPLGEAIYNETKSAEVDLGNKEYDEMRWLLFQGCAENERDRTAAPAPEPPSPED